MKRQFFASISSRTEGWAVMVDYLGSHQLKAYLVVKAGEGDVRIEEGPKARGPRTIPMDSEPGKST